MTTSLGFQMLRNEVLPVHHGDTVGQSPSFLPDPENIGWNLGVVPQKALETRQGLRSDSPGGLDLQGTHDAVPRAEQDVHLCAVVRAPVVQRVVQPFPGRELESQFVPSRIIAISHA